MKKLLIITITLLFLFMQIHIPVSAEQTNNYGTGLLVDTYDEIEKYLETTSTRSSLPSSVDNTSKFPSPGNQGSQNSCVGWAVGYALKSGSEYRKRAWTVSSTNHIFSPSYIYNQLNDGTDSGATIIDALELVVEQGVCTLPYFPYNQNSYTLQPSSVQIANANLYKASEFHTILGINNIKEKIYQNYGVVIGIDIYPDFTNLSYTNSVYDTVSGTKQDSHAICLIGYDDNVGSNGAFKFINSWGTDWGCGGYGWISYDTVADSSPYFDSPYLDLVVGYYFQTGTDNYIMGDIDKDGIIGLQDARTALQGSQNLISLSSEQFVLADVNGDAILSESDSTEILSVASGIQPKFSLYY